MLYMTTSARSTVLSSVLMTCRERPVRVATLFTNETTDLSCLKQPALPDRPHRGPRGRLLQDPERLSTNGSPTFARNRRHHEMRCRARRVSAGPTPGTSSPTASAYVRSPGVTR